MKLIEHSYIKNNFMLAVESNLGPNGPFYMTRVVWAGDYAEPEPDSENNLNTMAMDSKQKAIRAGYDTHEYRYIINHSKGLYIDKNTLGKSGLIIHPLSLLTAEGNGKGGGDYRGRDNDMCGVWARDIISVNDSVPPDFYEFVRQFSLDD
jgi:hypothetical protein